MVRIARNKDSRVLAEMAVQMWDSNTVDELEAEFAETLNDKQSAFFIKYINDLFLSNKLFCFDVDLLLGCGGAGVIEHSVDSAFEGGKDHAAEESVESCENDCADYDADDDFYTCVDVTLCLCVIKSTLCLDCESVCLVLNVFEKLFHKSLPRIFL